MIKSRKTRQKELIESEISRINAFFTAEELYSKLLKKDSSLGLATIYRFLKSLEKDNKVYSYICDRRKIYSNEKKNHCHFICDKTGKTIHFELNNLDFLKYVKDNIPGNIRSFQLEIHGVCDKCG